jgi:hypothetical protein
VVDAGYGHENGTFAWIMDPDGNITRDVAVLPRALMDGVLHLDAQ